MELARHLDAKFQVGSDWRRCLAAPISFVRAPGPDGGPCGRLVGAAQLCSGCNTGVPGRGSVCSQKCVGGAASRARRVRTRTVSRTL